MNQPLTLRSRLKNQTREALIQAVLQQSIEGQAFSSMSLRQVTKKAGVVPAAFYRHFDDMESLGKALVQDHLTIAFADLRKHMMMGQISSYHEQMSVSIDVFFDMVDEHPDYWYFLVSERWGGSPAVVDAIDQQLQIFTKQLSKDLNLLPVFAHINKEDKLLLAQIGVNLFIGWVMGWLNLKQSPKTGARTKKAATLDAQKKYKEYCTRQAKLVFYGAANWNPNSS